MDISTNFKISFKIIKQKYTKKQLKCVQITWMWSKIQTLAAFGAFFYDAIYAWTLKISKQQTLLIETNKTWYLIRKSIDAPLTQTFCSFYEWNLSKCVNKIIGFANKMLDLFVEIPKHGANLNLGIYEWVKTIDFLKTHLKRLSLSFG